MTTSIPVSTLPKAMRAIVTAIQAQLVAANESDVMLCVGTPGPDLQNDIIQVASAIRRKETPHALVGSGGAGWMEEQYTIDVSISSAVASTTTLTGSLAASDRAWKLVAYVETAVRTDPSLGGVVSEAYPSRTTGGKPTIGNGSSPSRMVTVTIPIHCTALI